MGVICFSSLKGGVGKTSVSVNVAHAFAKRGCKVLIIDFDPVAHTSRLFYGESSKAALNGSVPRVESTLAHLFLDKHAEAADSPIRKILRGDTSLLAAIPVRSRLDLISSGSEIRHFLGVQGTRAFIEYFPRFLQAIKLEYDHIVFDTAPDFNVILRNCLAVSDLAVVPVDASEMSIYCLEELLSNSRHIKFPTWSIVRTMVNRQAKRMQQLSVSRLQNNFNEVRQALPEDDSDLDIDIENNQEFISLIRKKTSDSIPEAGDAAGDDSPVYLLNSVVHRTEQQNRLSFVKNTAFDNQSTQRLAQEYWAVASELENVLALRAANEQQAMRKNPPIKHQNRPSAIESSQAVDKFGSISI